MALPEGCKEIPDHINFGYNLLLTPTLEEMGMPKAMASCIYARPLAPLGSWVERGEPLTEITFVHYRFNDDTGIPIKIISRLLGASKEMSFTETIYAPISGFNIVVRNSPTRTTHSLSCFNGLIDFKYALPVLLIPDDEPEWNAYDLQSNFRRLSSYIKSQWEQGIHNLGSCGDYKRVSIARALSMDDGYNIGTVGSKLDVTTEDIEKARQWTLDRDSVYKIQWPVCTYDDYCNRKYSVGDYETYYDVQGYVSEYRSKDEKLRQKLKHLDKMIMHGDSKKKTGTIKHDYDIFISHASEDKESIARPLYDALIEKGVSVWFDEAVLVWGNSLRRKIDDGLKACKYGVVILSPDFFAKEWPQKELDALFVRETSSGEEAILPLLHKIDHNDLSKYAPTIADKLAVKSNESIPVIVDKLLQLLNKS